MFTAIGKILSDPLRVRQAFAAHAVAVAKAVAALKEPIVKALPDLCLAPPKHPCPYRGRRTPFSGE